MQFAQLFNSSNRVFGQNEAVTYFFLSISNKLIDSYIPLYMTSHLFKDFDRYDFGDPWEEFNRIVWSAAASPHFATGQLRGYFSDKPPQEFFKLLAFYIASNTISSNSLGDSLGTS